MMINGKTMVLTIFGDPVAHSLSPTMYNAAFQELGWNCVYVPSHVLSEDIVLAVRGIRALNFKGANITIPHKRAVVPELDEIRGDARLSGSVNTILNREGRLIGISTDGAGLIRSLREDGDFAVAGKNVLLLGAGGAAAAVIHRLAASGIKALTVINRDVTKAVNIKEKVWHNTKFEISAQGLSRLENLDWSRFDLLINTTPVGMHDEASLVPTRFLRPELFVYDLVYKKGDTLLVNRAKSAGCKTLTGLSLLLYQGVESFKFWFEVDPPVAAMRRALAQAVGKGI